MKEDPTPQGPAMFGGVDVTLLADPGDEDDYRKKHPRCCIPDCDDDAERSGGIRMPYCKRHGWTSRSL